MRLTKWLRTEIETRGVLHVLCQFRTALDDATGIRLSHTMTDDLLDELNMLCNRWVEKNQADPSHPLTNGA